MAPQHPTQDRLYHNNTLIIIGECYGLTMRALSHSIFILQVTQRQSKYKYCKECDRSIPRRQLEIDAFVWIILVLDGCKLMHILNLGMMHLNKYFSYVYNIGISTHRIISSVHWYQYLYTQLKYLLNYIITKDGRCKCI